MRRFTHVISTLILSIAIVACGGATGNNGGTDTNGAWTTTGLTGVNVHFADINVHAMPYGRAIVRSSHLLPRVPLAR